MIARWGREGGEEGRLCWRQFPFFVYIFNEKDLALVPFGHFILTTFCWLLVVWAFIDPQGIHTHRERHNTHTHTYILISKLVRTWHKLCQSLAICWALMSSTDLWPHVLAVCDSDLLQMLLPQLVHSLLPSPPLPCQLEQSLLQKKLCHGNGFLCSARSPRGFFVALCHLCVACHLFNYARVGDNVGCKLYSYSMREASALLLPTFAKARPTRRALHEHSRNVC